MIDGLLAYSRINTLGSPLKKVSLSAAINSAILELRTAMDAMNAEVIYDVDIPDVLGDASQLKDLFFHLIDNSMKYRSDYDPLIKISWEQKDHGIELSVADNGIGIDDRNSDNVFTIFKRIGTKDEVPGAGVGLAICRRIVLRHYGRIWLSDPSTQGATISFNLRTPECEIAKPHLGHFANSFQRQGS